MCTTYPYHESTDKHGRPAFYARFRTLRDADGNPIQVQLTRYTYAYGRRPVTGPRGGRNHQRFARCVYYANGTFYKACNYQDAGGNWYNGVAPVDGTIWVGLPPAYTRERGDAPCVSIACEHGAPARAFDGEVTYWTDADGTAYLEQLLHLDRTPRARKAA